MNRRVLAAAFVATVMLPGAGSAQMVPLQDDPSWTPRLRITPFVGYLTSSSRVDQWFSTGSSTEIDRTVDVEVGGGMSAGLVGTLALKGPWGVTAMAAYGSREALIFAPDDGELFELDGDNNIFYGRAGVNLWLIEEAGELTMRRLNASAFAGVTVMHERPSNQLVSDLIGSGTHLGVNVGIEGEYPFASDRFALQLALEDNIMWWDETQAGNLAFAFIDDGSGNFTRAQTTAVTASSNAWLIRAGISIRLR
jgi:hypothetical protein